MQSYYEGTKQANSKCLIKAELTSSMFLKVSKDSMAAAKKLKILFSSDFKAIGYFNIF